MSNSPLVNYTKISPNKTTGRNHVIDRITPHCVVGQVTAESLGNWFAQPTTQASSNYGIDRDGRVAMYVEEKDRSWCTSSSSNDNRAVTIECASATVEPYEFKDVVYRKLIDLCVDICNRNGKTKLIWIGDKEKTLSYVPEDYEMVLTVHRWFANKSCPGDWLYSRLDDLAEEVTNKLAQLSMSRPETFYRVQTGAFSFIANATQLKRKLSAAGFDTYIVKHNGMYKVQVGAYKSYENAYKQMRKLIDSGFSAFVTTESGTAVGATESEPKEVKLKVGDRVKLSSDANVYGKDYGFQTWVYKCNLYVREVNGDRIVIATNTTGSVTGAVHKKFLTKI